MFEWTTNSRSIVSTNNMHPQFIHHAPTQFIPASAAAVREYILVACVTCVGPALITCAREGAILFVLLAVDRRRNRFAGQPRDERMDRSQLVDAIAEASQLSKNDVKAVIEAMTVVGYKELNESGEFVIPGFAKITVVNKPATEARTGVNPFTKEPMEFAAKPASKSVKASPLKVAKDAV